MIFGYADPPYPGQAAKHYSDHPDFGGEVDHAALVAQLERDYPDGWALSTSSPALFFVQSHIEALGLSQMRGDYRFMPWVKPFASFKPGVGVAYAWEPVIVRGGRSRTRQQPTVRDWVAVNITLKRGISGAKPDPFCFWLFEVLNAQTGDELVDLFPGSGAVGRAWQTWQTWRLMQPEQLELVAEVAA